MGRPDIDAIANETKHGDASIAEGLAVIKYVRELEAALFGPAP